MTADDETLRLYEKVVASQPSIEIKGKTSRYTSLNGHMFSFITKEGGLALRLSDEDRDAFNEKHDGGPVIQHGSVMRGYVLVPASVLAKTAQMKRLFAASVSYIESLKPKPTTRKASKKKTAKKASGAKKASRKKPKR